MDLTFEEILERYQKITNSLEKSNQKTTKNSGIKYTKALKNIWDFVNEKRITLKLNPISVTKNKTGNSKDIFTISSSFQIKTNFITDEKYQIFKSERTNNFDFNKTSKLIFESKIDEFTFQNYAFEKEKETGKIWKNLYNKFDFYKQKANKEKKLMIKQRFNDSDNSSFADSDEKCLSLIDKLQYREKIMRLPQNIENKFDDKGNLKDFQKITSSKINLKISNSVKKGNSIEKYFNFIGCSFKIKKTAPNLQEYMSTIKKPIQYPYLTEFCDFKTHLPSFMQKYTIGFKEDFQLREKSGIFSTYFLSRVSRICLEDSSKFAISIKNENKLPYYIKPQNFNFKSEDLEEINKFQKNEFSVKNNLEKLKNNLEDKKKRMSTPKKGLRRTGTKLKQTKTQIIKMW